MGSIIFIIIAAILIAFGFFFVYHLDRDIGEKYANMVLIGGLVLIGLGGFILVKVLTWPVLKIKLIGLVVMLAGYWLVTKFPDVTDYQQEGLGWTAVIMGVVLMIIGGYVLLF